MSSFATGTSVLLFVIVPVMVTLLPTFTGSISSISMVTSALTTSNSSSSELYPLYTATTVYSPVVSGV